MGPGLVEGLKGPKAPERTKAANVRATVARDPTPVSGEATADQDLILANAEAMVANAPADTEHAHLDVKEDTEIAVHLARERAAMASDLQEAKAEDMVQDRPAVIIVKDHLDVKEDTGTDPLEARAVDMAKDQPEARADTEIDRYGVRGEVMVHGHPDARVDTLTVVDTDHDLQDAKVDMTAAAKEEAADSRNANDSAARAVARISPRAAAQESVRCSYEDPETP